MAFQVVPNTAEARLTYAQALNDREMQNILYFERGLGWTQAQLLVLANAVVAQWVGGPMNHLATDMSLIDVTCRDLGEEFGAVASAATTPVFGTNLQAPAPPNVAALVRFLATVGPPRRGGIFFPQVAEANVAANGELLAAFRTALDTDLTSAIGSIESTSGSTHVIVSRYHTPVENQPPVKRQPALTATVTGYEVRRRVASQRDRRATLPG